jgi:Flp pilus assembly pilin Flp
MAANQAEPHRSPISRRRMRGEAAIHCPQAPRAPSKRNTSMIRNFLASLRGAASDRKGVTAAEYAILAVGVVIVVGGAVLAFQGPLSDAFTNIGTQITSTQTSVRTR